ncbi:MAG: hypothetical protein QM831_01220 [Kofleriaceae bacterium]
MRWLLVFTFAGCVTSHKAIVGPFVTDLVEHDGNLGVAACTIEVVTERDYTWWWLGATHSTDRKPIERHCSFQEVRL